MNWKYNHDFGFYYANTDDGNYYAIDCVKYYDPTPWVALHNTPDRQNGSTLWNKRNWEGRERYATKELAMEACERHYRLLVLQ